MEDAEHRSAANEAGERHTHLYPWGWAMLGLAAGLLIGHLDPFNLRRTAAQPARERSPLGDTIPSLELTTLDGRREDLRQRLLGHSTVMYVFGAAECAGCSNLGLEFEIIRRAFPNIRTLFVGSGSSASAFSAFSSTSNIAESTLIDEERQILSVLRLQREPIVLLVDAAGRVVFVDARSASQAAQYPMGRVLGDLTVSLHEGRVSP